MHRLRRLPLRIDNSRPRAVSAVGSAIWAALAEAHAAAASAVEARAVVVPDVQALRAAAAPAGRRVAALAAAAVAAVSAEAVAVASAAAVVVEAVPVAGGNAYSEAREFVIGTAGEKNSPRKCSFEKREKITWAANFAT